jgi:glyoxylase-like metal-dependent hydrolase (beta-lactamase superfamily II)
MDQQGKRTLSRRAALRTAGVAGGAAAIGLAMRGQGARAQQPPPMFPQSVAELTRVAEDVYMWRSVGHNTMFVTTDEGVIAADPIGLVNQRSPQMYRAAVASVTDRPVTHLIYSHDHADHITGGFIFADTARFYSHQLAAPKIDAQDNVKNPAPTELVDERMSLTVGGKTVELIHVGRNHSDNSLVIHYPARRLLFAVDFIPVNRLPFQALMGDFPLEWIESLSRIERDIDFDVLVPGHGPLGSKRNVTADREYFEELIAAIRAARAQGLADNSEQMVAAVRTALAPKYGTWEQFSAWLPLNIQGIIREGAAN